MLYSSHELKEFARAIARVAAILDKLKKNAVTPREKLFLMIGMRASHIEEAITYGNPDRAQSHLREMVRMMRKL